MSSTRSNTDGTAEAPPSRAAELKTFLLLTIVLAPVTAVVCVGGYGFIVWMSQLIFGPPIG
ncbi:MAG: periplasmic nitrate reductase, NapE protein [Alphaproteobacteria bacterium]|nr:periplasmic nitrate reductase, NapE protein [Alphaproteobacteria bacterium]